MACCPSVWWCTPEGPVEVEFDENGEAYRPEGATGEPFATRDAAVAECPDVPDNPPVAIVTACNNTWFGSPSALKSPLTAKLNWNYPGSSYAGQSFYGQAVWNESLQQYDITVDVPDEPGGGINYLFARVTCGDLSGPAPATCATGDCNPARINGGISANWPNFGGSLIALGCPSINACMTYYTTSPFRVHWWLYDASWWTLEVYE